MFGHRGLSFSTDPTIPQGRAGPPDRARVHRGASRPASASSATSIPAPTCSISYLGYMWWDEETDGELMYPAEQKHPTAEEFTQSQMSNPDETAARGLWSDPQFLRTGRRPEPAGAAHAVRRLPRPRLGLPRRLQERPARQPARPPRRAGRRTIDRRADGSRAHAGRAQGRIASKPRKPAGSLRPREASRDGVPGPPDGHPPRKGHALRRLPFRPGRPRQHQAVRRGARRHRDPVHRLPRHASGKRATLRTTGPASDTSAPDGSGRDLAALRTPFGKRRFERRGDKIIQNSMVEKDLAWEIIQVADTIDPRTQALQRQVRPWPRRSASTPTDRWSGATSPRAATERRCAHANENMSCIACHSSWNPSCFGCHLPQKANKKMPQLHNEGDVTRNYVSYNFQTLRDDVFMLARDGDVTGNRIGPARSSCADPRRLVQRQPRVDLRPAADDLGRGAERHRLQHQRAAHGRGGRRPRCDRRSRTPTSCRATDTKTCTDCHLSKNDDNNAIMAQLLMQGTNYVNFIGRYCWVAAGDHGLAAVEVTERDEPQAVIGSSLHQLAFPDDFRKHLEHGRHARATPTSIPARTSATTCSIRCASRRSSSVQARGEYLYAACGEAGLRVFDIAFIDDKGFSERIVTAPVSPLGQRFYVRTQVRHGRRRPRRRSPRTRRARTVRENHEQTVHAALRLHLRHRQVRGTDRRRRATTLDGNPLNNFLHRELTFNPDGILNGARASRSSGPTPTSAATPAWWSCRLDDPKHPRGHGGARRADC